MDDIDPATKAILESPSYELAERDVDLLARDELLPIRLQLEFLRPELALTDLDVDSTIVVFGGTHVVERVEAQQRLEDAEPAAAQNPDDPQLAR